MQAYMLKETITDQTLHTCALARRMIFINRKAKYKFGRRRKTEALLEHGK
jgi:hypothetical protein